MDTGFDTGQMMCTGGRTAFSQHGITAFDAVCVVVNSGRAFVCLFAAITVFYTVAVMVAGSVTALLGAGMVTGEDAVGHMFVRIGGTGSVKRTYILGTCVDSMVTDQRTGIGTTGTLLVNGGV